MGHYDDAYEAEAERQAEELRTKNKKALQKIDKLFDQLSTAITQNVPHQLQDTEAYNNAWSRLTEANMWVQRLLK